MQEEEEQDTKEKEVKDGGKEEGGADEDTQQKSFRGTVTSGEHPDSAVAVREPKGCG